MKHIMISGALCASLAGCAGLGSMADRIGLGGKPGAAVVTPVVTPVAVPAPAVETPVLAPETAAPPPPPAARTPEALDTTTPAQRAAAAAPAPAAAPSTALGKTVVSLGSPTEPGLWLKTPLVKAETQGRVTNPATGKSSLVTLLPLDGPATAGSRMSLPALRLIGASLADLTEVEVSLAG